jgi:hypothetical protein
MEKFQSGSPLSSVICVSSVICTYISSVYQIEEIPGLRYLESFKGRAFEPLLQLGIRGNLAALQLSSFKGRAFEPLLQAANAVSAWLRASSFQRKSL